MPLPHTRYIKRAQLSWPFEEYRNIDDQISLNRRALYIVNGYKDIG